LPHYTAQASLLVTSVASECPVKVPQRIRMPNGMEIRGVVLFIPVTIKMP